MIDSVALPASPTAEDFVPNFGSDEVDEVFGLGDLNGDGEADMLIAQEDGSAFLSLSSASAGGGDSARDNKALTGFSGTVYGVAAA